jgi:hypothetical protein
MRPKENRKTSSEKMVIGSGPDFALNVCVCENMT